MRIPRLYSWLIGLYPATFRERYRHAMEQQFGDDYRDATTPAQRAVVGLRAFIDVAISLPAEFSRELRQDLKGSVRVYGKHPVTAILAIGALGLSIGACTGVFAVLNALLLRSLPFRAPEQLVELKFPPVTPFSGRPAFEEWSRRSSYLQDAAVFAASDMNLTVGREVVRIKTAETSANFLSLLGTSMVLGRTFTAEEGTPGRTGVAVISYGLWQQAFGADPAVSGASIRLNGIPFTVIGVAPPRFDFPARTAVWVPTAFDFERVPRRGVLFFDTIGRLREGVAIAQARSVFQTEIQRVAPERLRGEEVNRAALLPLREKLSGPVAKASWVLAAMIALLLIGACANVAHLLLARLAIRRHEFAVRTSLGASGPRIVQQLVTEATALTMTGAVIGLVVAYWTSRLASSVVPPALAVQEYSVLDWRVMAFAAALALFTGLVFGVLPSFFLRQGPALLIRTQPGVRDRMTRRIRVSLMAVQAALTVVLLTGSIAMGRTFLQSLSTDLGFTPANAITLNVSLQGTKHRNAAAERKYYDEALERLRSVAGVEAAGAVSYVPLAEHLYMGGSFKLDSGHAVKMAITNAATPGYFRAIGTKLIAGRDFPSSSAASEREVVVNSAFAEAAGLGTSAVGRRIISPWGGDMYTIIGIVEASRFSGPEGSTAPMIYWPIREEPPANLTLVARVTGDAESYVAACRDAVRGVDASVPVYDVQTLEQRLEKVLARPRFFVTATLAITCIALLLAIAGTFGCTAHAVMQRSREFGVRMALGASHTSLRTMLMRDSVVPSVVGIIAGIVVAAAGGRYLSQLVSQVHGVDALVCAAAATVVVATAVASSWSAAVRLLAIQPAAAVRSE